jgi:histidine phosphotransfer protein HptB
LAIDTHALDKLREIVGGEEADLAELVASFLEEGPMLVERLTIAQRSGDLAGTRRPAHSLKSNARDMGATGLSELCAKLEAQCIAGDLPLAPEIEATRIAFDIAAAELRQMFPTASTP